MRAGYWTKQRPSKNKQIKVNELFADLTKPEPQYTWIQRPNINKEMTREKRKARFYNKILLYIIRTMKMKIDRISRTTSGYYKRSLFGEVGRRRADNLPMQILQYLDDRSGTKMGLGSVHDEQKRPPHARQFILRSNTENSFPQSMHSFCLSSLTKWRFPQPSGKTYANTLPKASPA